MDERRTLPEPDKRRVAKYLALAFAALVAHLPAPRIAEAQDPAYLVKDINDAQDDLSSWGLLFVDEALEIGGVAYFVANDGIQGRELWRSDGTAAGTHLLKDIAEGSRGSAPSGLVSVGQTFYFVANSDTGADLWRSDGTAEGTHLVRDFNPGSSVSAYTNLVGVGGSLLFGAYEDATGFELWRSDGTSAGTSLVKDIAPGAAHGLDLFGAILVEASGMVYFTASSSPGSNFTVLWKTDGTAAGTVPVRDISNDGAGSVQNLTNVNGTLFFSASDTVDERRHYSGHEDPSRHRQWHQQLRGVEHCNGQGRSFLLRPE